MGSDEADYRRHSEIIDAAVAWAGRPEAGGAPFDLQLALAGGAVVQGNYLAKGLEWVLLDCDDVGDHSVPTFVAKSQVVTCAVVYWEDRDGDGQG
jgi:hypothetical protein